MQRIIENKKNESNSSTNSSNKEIETRQISNKQIQSIKSLKNNNIDIESILKKIHDTKIGNEVKFTQNQIKSVCLLVRQHFLKQNSLLRLSSPIKIVGDIHGQFSDLLRIFNKNGYPSQKNKYLFLGDYVDRGKQSIQTIILLFILILKHPQSIFLLRGNHQTAQVNKLYGFFDQCKRRYDIKIWKIFVDCFNCMPISAIIEDKILCMHGGISPQLNKIKKIQTINRPTEIPPIGLLCDLLWSDPVEDKKGWNDNNQRGISKLFGPDVVEKFLENNNLDLICRAHQIVEQGYQFFAKKQLVTIFSAPNYCGQFDNNGAVMIVGKQLVCSFEIFKPQLKKQLTVNNTKKKKMPKYIN